MVVSDFQGYPKSMIFNSPEKAYATSYYWLIVTLALSLSVSDIRLLISKLSIENCGQTATKRHGHYRQFTGSRQHPIRWYHRRPFTTYRL